MPDDMSTSPPVRRRARPGHQRPPRDGVRSGARPQHEQVLELRRVLHHHLHPLGLPDAVRLRPPARRPAGHALGLAARRRRSCSSPACRWARSARPSRPPAASTTGRPSWHPADSGPIWSWFTGWFNLLGQVAVTAGISFGCAFSISAFLVILTGNAYWLEPYATILILAVVLFIQGLLNTFSVRLVALLNDVSVYWHLIGVAIIFVLLFWAPDVGQPPVGQLPVRQRGLEGVRGPVRASRSRSTCSSSAC